MAWLTWHLEDLSGHELEERLQEGEVGAVMGENKNRTKRTTRPLAI